MFDGRWRTQRREGPAARRRQPPPHRHHRRPPHRARPGHGRRARRVAIGNGALRAGLAAAGRSPPCPTCSTARWPRPRARPRRGAPSSTRSPTGSPTPALRRRRLVPRRRPQPGRIAVLPLAVLARVDAHLLRAGQGRVARLRRPRRAHGAGRAHHPARLRPAVRVAAGAGPVADAGAHRCSPPSSASSRCGARPVGPAGAAAGRALAGPPGGPLDRADLAPARPSATAVAAGDIG